MDKLIGKRLEGFYEIVELIGIGGMANVYKATDLRTQQTVSVKVLREEFMHDKDLVCRFKNESKAISILNHPNIVKVYDVSVTDSLQYIVMEFIDGITLREYLKQRGNVLTWRETVHFISQILNALQHAHENGVVHRDVKPQNIMLLPSGDLKMMDFGIARIARAENQLVSGKAMGSVHYISPEQAKGEATDAKSDIYSAGVMMYEMLSGKLPFAEGSVVEVAIKQISDTPEPLATLAPEAPHALVEITERAMAKNPEERYQSVVEMLDAIREFKKDPDILFAYKYMTDGAPVKVIDKVMNKNKNQKADTTAAKPKKKKTKKVKRRPNFFLPVLFGVTVAFTIGCGMLCKMILENSDNVLFSTKEDIVLEDFIGLTVDEVAKSDQYERIEIIYEEDYNSSVQAGLVYKQSPVSGRTVKEGQEITLTVSLGTKYVSLSDYSSLSQADAQDALTSEGLYVVVIKNVDSSVAIGYVIGTDPAAGETVEAGSTVYLYVSMAEVQTTTTMPDLIGLTLEDANTLLTQSKITMGNMIYEYSDEYPVDTIIATGVEAGETVSVNGRVAVTISLGPEPTPEPTPKKTVAPTATPTATPAATATPTAKPAATAAPTAQPVATAAPTVAPTVEPTAPPTTAPTAAPTETLTVTATATPTVT